ncbi:MAG: hypothetical protein IIB54_01405 [Planctomycetes bacterium]|nr:hypothetical protein [Planctomycetota bacterium]
MPAKTKKTGNRPATRTTKSSQAISRKLSKRIGEHKYDMWFGHARMAIQGDQLDIATDSEFVANWIGTHFASDLRGVAEETLGKNASINVHVAPNLFGREEDDRKPSEHDDASPVAKPDSRREKTARPTVSASDPPLAAPR